MPPLTTPQGLAVTVTEKALALRQRFYPQTEADLSDIEDLSFTPDTFHNPLESEARATEAEVRAALYSQKPWKAPGPDGIPAGFLQAMGDPLIKALTGLTTLCWTASYYPVRFRQAQTIVLKKPGKASYSEPGSWRPIALLSTIGKVIESVTATRIRDLAETHRLLPDCQMGARQGRSVETALDLLTEQIHTVWNSGKFVSTLLSLDVSGAFDTVNATRLLDVLRQRRIPPWLVYWVRAFISDRQSTLLIQGEETETFRLLAGVPQGSPLSPILYLFYNAELLEACQDPQLQASAIGFVDDTNILVYGTSTESNCQRLEEIHQRCISWAARYGTSFAPQKYELIHFARRRSAFNLSASLRLQDVDLHPSTEVRILGVWVDPKLKWGAHLRRVHSKTPTLIQAFARVATSTWGASLNKARQVYTAVIRPAIAYGAPIWHTPGNAKQGLKGHIKKLQTVQNKCLQIISGAYKATPTLNLEVETFVPPLDLHLNGLVAGHRQRLASSGQLQVIETACRAIRGKLRERRRRPPRPTPGQAKSRWAARWLEEGHTPEGVRQRAGSPIQQAVLRDWQKQYKASRRAKRMDRLDQEPSAAVLQLHDKLRKAESSVLIQIRTGCIGLAPFLRRMRVPGVESARCQCDTGAETARHVVEECPLEDREGLSQAPNLRQLITDKKTTSTITKWFIRTGRLRQFHLAGELLYGASDGQAEARRGEG